MKILKCLLMIVTAPVVLVLTLFVWFCTGLIYISGLVLGLLSTVIALLGVAVLITSPNFHNRDRYSICGGRNGVSSPHLPPLFLFVCILVFCLSVPDNMSRIRSVAKE